MCSLGCQTGKEIEKIISFMWVLVLAVRSQAGINCPTGEGPWSRSSPGGALLEPWEGAGGHLGGFPVLPVCSRQGSLCQTWFSMFWKSPRTDLELCGLWSSPCAEEDTAGGSVWDSPCPSAVTVVSPHPAHPSSERIPGSGQAQPPWGGVCSKGRWMHCLPQEDKVVPWGTEFTEFAQ